MREFFPIQSYFRSKLIVFVPGRCSLLSVWYKASPLWMGVPNTPATTTSQCSNNSSLALWATTRACVCLLELSEVPYPPPLLPSFTVEETIGLLNCSVQRELKPVQPIKPTSKDIFRTKPLNMEATL